MLEVIYQEVAKLKKNNYTKKPIQTQFGWHIIKLEDIRQAPLPSFEEKESELKTALQKAKLKQHLDELRNLAKVKFK
jgi:peptidyl-prolyl cis-trans isomerase C